jgi:ligand-binding sensor domain-containing protein
MIAYPYGEKNSMIFLSATYPDWSLLHGACTLSELKLVRDLISYLKAPHLFIPMFDVSTNPIQVQLNVKIKNTTEFTASKALLKTYTPFRDRVVFETEQSITLPPGEEIEIPISFTMTDVQTQDLGIYGTYYELFDEEANQVLNSVESDSGRFAVYSTPAPYVPKEQCQYWLSVDNEEVHFDDTVSFVLHARNYTDTEKQVEFKYQWNHLPIQPLTTLTLPPGETVEYSFEKEAKGVMFWVYSYGAYGPNKIGKGFTLTRPKTRSYILLNHFWGIKAGMPISYKCQVNNSFDKDIDCNIKLSLLDAKENLLEVLYNDTHHLTGGGTYEFSDTHPMPDIEVPGKCWLKLEVERPDGTKEIQKTYVAYFQPRVTSSWPVLDIPEGTPPGKLFPGVTYPVKITLHNAKDWYMNDHPSLQLGVDNGKLIFAFENEQGVEAGKAEIDGIHIYFNEVKEFSTAITFNPPQPDVYRLKVYYQDETRPIPVVCNYGTCYQSIEAKPSAWLDKSVYWYLDTADLSVNLTGSGNYTIQLTCPELNFNEQRTVQADPNGGVVEHFQIPIGLHPVITCQVDIIANTWNYQLTRKIYARAFTWDKSITLDKTKYKLGEQLSGMVTLQETGGYPGVVNGEVRLQAVELGFDINLPVSLQPGEKKQLPFTFTIPFGIDNEYYPLQLEFYASGLKLVQKSDTIYVPDALLDMAEPPKDIDAGNAITLGFTNTGGKNGNFDIDVQLKDNQGKEVAEFSGTIPLLPGEYAERDFIVPEKIKTGEYILVQSAKDLESGKNFKEISRVNISGLIVTLNSRTLKDIYFDTELVSGQSEITFGSEGIDNGVLQAKIIRYIKISGIEEEEPGEFISYNMIEAGYSSGNMLYLATDKGVLRYDVVSAGVEMLYSFDSNPGFNCRELLLSSEGELWIASVWSGIWRQNSDGNWEHYTTADGLADNLIYDIIEVNGTSGPEIWVATGGGISVFRGGIWKNYTTADGLPANRTYRLALDGSGAVWASTSGGVVKFNGTNFENVGAPFGSTNVSDKMTATADGSVWMVAVSQLYRYQPGSGQWNTWNLIDLFPGAYTYISIYVMETINGQLWMRTNFRDSSYKYFEGMIHYNGSFVDYTEKEIPGLAGLNYTPIIPGNADNDAAYFTCQLGFMAFDTGTWQHRVLEIDSHKLAGAIYSLAKDKNGNLWAGTEYGLSRYDVKSKQWTNYCSTPDNQLVWRVLQVDTDGQNSVYGYFPYLDPKGGLIKIDIDNGNVEAVHFPTFAFYQDEPYSINRMTVDTQGRAWFGYSYLWYYDDGEGQWHQFSGIKSLNCLTKDLSGGVWLCAKVYQGDYLQCHLLHIKNDMTVDQYTRYNSDLLPGEKGRLYLDQEGILWITSEYYIDNQRTLQSFDGSNWIDYSNYEGFPYYGVSNMIKDYAGKLWALDHIGNLYTLENDKFVLRREGISYDYSLVFSNGTWYSAGNYSRDYWNIYFYPTNFIKISSTQGLIEEELWSQNYNLNLASGGTEQVDLLTGKTFPPGAYELKTALLSPLNQVLAASGYSFVVKDSALSISLLADCSPCGFLKPDTDLGITVEALNNTQETKSNLNFIVKKISPDGTEEVVLSDTLNLAPGQLETFALTFNESTTGTWRLAAFLSDPATGEEKESTLLVGVTEPMVTMTVLAPGYAGDESFDVKINLVNEGNITAVAQLTVQASSDGNSETPIDETIVLNPQEERMLTVNDTLTADKDKTYTISLSGDVQQTETKIVKYGYIENFNINVLPVYREGVVSIGYTLANGGGLAFVDDLHVELVPVGGAVPMYIIDRSYNLYPGESPIIDALDFQLLPGNYELRYRTSLKPANQVSVFTVQPSGIGVVSFTGGTDGTHPLGMKEINFQITNTDTIAGHIPVTITLTNVLNPTPLLLETRDYYLAPGEIMADFINYDFIEKGNYQLVISGAKLPVPGQASIQIVDVNEVTAVISVGTPVNGQIPVTLSIDNSGFEGFTGTVVIESGGFVHSETVEMAFSSQGQQVVTLETAGLTAGTSQIKAVLYNNSGELLAETTAPITISPADIQVIEVPLNMEIDAGSFCTASMKIKNQGHLWGEAQLKLNALESLTDQREIALYPGEEIDINDIFIDVPADLPTGNYPFYYTLSGKGVENGTSAGNFNIKVNGTSLEVEASLDRSLYNPGETAVLTLNITSTTSTDAALEAVVNWGVFNETRPFTLNNGSTALVFNIPLDEEREEKVFYGIYHQEGKGIHLNDIYLNFYGAISVETDKQVYAPGEIIHAVFTGDQTGVLTVQAFEETYTLNMSGSASASFQVPVDTLGGTYGISWNFAPTDPLQAGCSGSQLFDVSGLVVKVAKSQLEKGKYVPGEAINAQYVFESNRDITLGLRCWTTTPSEEWEYLGESSVTVSASKHVNALTSYSFTTTEAGTHHLVYGLYQENRLVVSGRLSFDVGNAVLLGISTDQWEYKTGSEPVTLKIDYFGEGFSQLQVYLDEENVHQQGITLSGTGSTELVLESSSISGGSHRVKVVLIQNNLTSTKTTGFTFGTHLPDLTAWLTDTLQDGLNYSVKIEVTNMGKTASTTTSLVFSDNGANVDTAGIPALPPDQSHKVTFNWSGSGKAGSHELMFEVDNTDTVKEFSETNNSLEFTLEVPALFYSLETDPPEKLSYPANTPINIVTRLINNQEIPALLTLDLSITNEESGVTIHNRIKEEQLPAFDSKVITDTFNTEVYPAGNYTLEQTVIGDNLNMHKELFLYFEPTRIVTGTLQVTPQQIPAKTPTEVTLTMKLNNAGNVPIEDEILQIDVFNKDLGEVVVSEELTVSIPMAEEITETKTMSLNLVEGNYEIWLKHSEEILALADLSAISAVKPSQTIGIYPRVLIINLNEKFLRGPGAFFSKRAPGQSNNPVDYLTALLQSQGIEYEIGVRLLDSYVKLNKGQANVNIVLGNEMGRKLRDEIKEKVWHGEGLILFCDKPTQNPEWIDFLGVTIKPIPGKTRETVIQILPNEFSSEGEIECPEELKLQMIKEKQDVVIIAQTKQKQYPVITYRKYGKGNILTINKSFCGGVQGGQFFQKASPLVSQLLLNAVTRFSQDIYTGSDLTRLLPLELSLKNESSEAKTLKIKTFLPYGVEAFDFKPEPEEGEELKWTITVPAVSTETISYWLKLPDQVNSFEIKTELFDEETKLDEVSTTFEVTQTVLFRIDELILELDMLGAAGKDAQLVRKAKHHLEQIRNRTVNSFIDYLLNLHDSIKAASYLGEVKSVDVSSQRIKTQDIMVILGRRFYEAVKTWGEVQLSPILEIIEK